MRREGKRPLVRRLCASAVLVLAALLGTAGSALAHDVLESSDPPNGAQLESGPKQVTLTFNEPVRDGAQFTTVTVIGPDGGNWAAGPARVDSNSVIAPLRDLGPAGIYQVGYRILSSDGHPVSGSITFTLTKPGPATTVAPAPSAQQAPSPQQAPSAQPAAQQTESGSVPIWPWIIGALILVVVGLIVALRLGKTTDKN